MNAIYEPMHCPPQSPGPYAVLIGKSDVYSYWTGKHWGRTALTPQETSINDEKSSDCYTIRVSGWRPIAGYIYGYDHKIEITSELKSDHKPKEFEPDEIKPELLSKRIRDWL